MKKLGYVVLALTLVACGGNSFETEGGTTVTYLKKGEGVLSQDSTEISFFNLKYDTESGYEIFATNEPAPMRVGGSFSENGGELFKILPKLVVGDSVTFKITASDLFENTFRAPLPDSIPAASKIAFFISLEKLQSQSEYYRESALKQKEFMESIIDTTQLRIDLNILNDYYKTNNIELTTTTENGIGIVITEAGNGPKPELGQAMQVKYAGYMLDGRDFDSGTYPVQLYLTSVILGWHEGLAQLNEGAKATLYIPSPLGYGPRRRSDVIVENSILVFDVELVEIGD
ncbi:FKBP-type peptidyl-prolyl cis-trans isomerase [Ekhidna sp. To15]|uniref:FKBP-type peptidyl-prolyl cis-trans isomerase n=1 Tax=Ekhidna sp. To15 TaxID=3395267 RepID=UPI003F5251F9